MHVVIRASEHLPAARGRRRRAPRNPRPPGLVCLNDTLLPVISKKKSGAKFLVRALVVPVCCETKRKKTDNPREGWEDGTPPPHRDFKERGVVH